MDILVTGLPAPGYVYLPHLRPFLWHVYVKSDLEIALRDFLRGRIEEMLGEPGPPFLKED